MYRIAEPTDAAGSATVTDVFHATFPDGAHDAEALLLAPDGRLHVVTKGDTGVVALYRFTSRCTVTAGSMCGGKTNWSIPTMNILR